MRFLGPPVDLHPVANLPPVAAALGTGVALISLFEAWQAGGTSGVATVPATALGLLLAAAALVLAKPGRGGFARELGRWCALGTVVIGFGVLAHYAIDWIWGPRLGLFTGSRWWSARPSAVGAAGLVFLATALLNSFAEHEGQRQRAGLHAAIALVLALMGLVGHAYEASELYGLNRWGGMAVPTALALGALATGVVFLDTTRGAAAVLASRSAGGHLLRRLTLAAILVPLVLGWIVLVALELEHMDAPFGIATLVVSLVVILVGLAVREGFVAQRIASEREMLLAREREARAEVTRILESINDAFIAVDRAWRFTYVNGEAERLLKKPRSELLSRSLWQEFPDTVAARFQEEYQRAREEQRTIQFEAPFRPLESWFHIRAYPTQQGLAIYFHDITDRRQGEAERERLLESETRAREEADQRRAELERVTESRARLMRGFSHDVRNPLSVADAQAWMLEEGKMLGPLTPRQRDSLAKIRRSIRRSLTLIDDLLEITRAEAGEIGMQHVPTDVSEVAREAVEDYQAPAIAAGLSLEIHAPRGLAASTDPARVRQILSNLLSNAVKYAAKGPVTVEARARDGQGPASGPWIAVSVSDSGPGIPSEKIESVFEEYTRLDPHAQPGAGIGLSISRRIARALGGDLTLASEAGRGSTFTLWLPPSTH
jgi:PAS domain S-box-containing protein